VKLHWKRILFAGISAELLLLAVYLPAKRYAGSAFMIIAVAEVIASMFQAGLWTVRRIESRLLLHGMLVGVVANVVYAALRETMAGHIRSVSPIEAWGNFFAVAIIKMLICTGGAFAGGRMKAKERSLPSVKFPI